MGKGQKALQTPRNRQRALQIIVQTGQFQDAFDALGVSESSFRRYRESNPDFDESCQMAKGFYKVMERLKYRVRIREKGLKLLEKRIDEETISDSALVHALFNESPNSL